MRSWVGVGESGIYRGVCSETRKKFGDREMSEKTWYTVQIECGNCGCRDSSVDIPYRQNAKQHLDRMQCGNCCITGQLRVGLHTLGGAG